ncbi:hydrogenase 4 subunit B [Orbus sturtevantii]|uniref:hydrogenase 4 subunit B n=1 Tax=Orbus sturtevantii TaxID=3074109 RepID=UPI00370DB29D
MPLSFSLLLCSIIVYGLGSLASILFTTQQRVAIYLSGIIGMIAAVLGLVAVIPTLLFGEIYQYSLLSPFAFSDCPLLLDRLAAFMIAVISLLALISSLYSLSYVQEYVGKGASAIGFFMNLFIASMVMLMVVDNAFYFIIFFEIMSLASYFLVISEQDEKAIKAGFIYFLIAHVGSVLIMASFFLLYFQSGSLNFASFRTLDCSPVMSSIIFLLAFFGFGAKAGMMPLHGWLPKAHPAAPSHASALMSGVMVKIGVFGIIKVGIDLLGATQLWWGIVVLAFGSISAVLGVLYALAEHDIKRLLAYHTVENVGIILMGVGVGMIGISINSPALAVLGLLGALYHLVNHAIFKGLLFLGAGSVIYRLHTKDMEKMGGLAKMMPYTAIAFLIGCMAISALPPLNGFISEWYTYQSLFSLTNSDNVLLKLVGPIAIVMLAITGALAAMCFVKVYGICFCGAPKTEKAAKVTDVPLSMISAMLLLALLCIVFGVGAFMVAPFIADIAMQLVQPHMLQSGSNITVNSGLTLIPGDPEQAQLSPILIFILLTGLILLPLVIYAVTRCYRPAFRQQGEPWACGYQYENDMAQSASNFTQPLRFMFAALYRLRQFFDFGGWSKLFVDKLTNWARKIEPLWDGQIIDKVVNFAQAVGQRVQILQQGNYRVYSLYIVVALVILLFLAVV